MAHKCECICRNRNRAMAKGTRGNISYPLSMPDAEIVKEYEGHACEATPEKPKELVGNVSCESLNEKASKISKLKRSEMLRKLKDAGITHNLDGKSIISLKKQECIDLLMENV